MVETSYIDSKNCEHCERAPYPSNSMKSFTNKPRASGSSSTTVSSSASLSTTAS